MDLLSPKHWHNLASSWHLPGFYDTLSRLIHVERCLHHLSAAAQVCPKYLDVCFLITYGVTLILSYTISDSFVNRWLQVITQGGVFALITVRSSFLPHNSPRPANSSTDLHSADDSTGELTQIQGGMCGVRAKVGHGLQGPELSDHGTLRVSRPEASVDTALKRSQS